MGKNTNKVAGGYSIYNNVRVIRGGAEYFDLTEQIAANAVYSLHLQTYIFDEDETGTRVANALMAAANRGVLVYVILDGYGSQALSKEFVVRLEEAGVNFRFFQPLLHSKNYYFGRRMHHKVIVADATVCMVGGLNISNRYNDMPDKAAWLDWAMYVEGEVAVELDALCVRIWNRAMLKKNCKATKPPALDKELTECKVRVRRNDWVFKKVEINRSYRELFANAKSTAVVMTSYFLPPRKLLQLMSSAARRGVHIKIVLTGKADVPLSKYAEKYLYPRLFRNNIEVYEYVPNVLHGKAAVYDNKWMTIGSYNLNGLSAFASIELNLDVQDSQTATRFHSMVSDIIRNDCSKITRDDFDASSNLIKRLFHYLSYVTLHVLFFLSTFYFSQQTRRN